MTYRPFRLARHCFPILGLFLVASLIASTGRGEDRSEGELVPNLEAVRQVEAGQCDVANAAWWGFHPQESTKALQAALRSKAKKIVIPKMPTPWVVDKIELVGSKEIIFEAGVEVVAKRGAFRGRGDSLFTALNQENLTIRGSGAVLRMWREDYAKPPYEKAEWRHCLSIRGCRNVLIEGLILRDSGGDGIYLGAGKGGAPNENIVIRNVICDSNYRQGISVITVRGLTIENVILRNTAGTPPQAGIDFEPNRPEEVLSDILMRNCLIENNRGYAIVVSAVALNAGSQPISIRLENCRTRGTNAGSLTIATRNHDGQFPTGVFEAVNCHFEDEGTAAIIIRSKPTAGLRVHLKDCEIVENSNSPRWPAPIVFLSRPGDQNHLRNVSFENLVIRDAAKRRILHFDNASGPCLKSISGTATIYTGTEVERVHLDEQIISEWFPCDPIHDLPIVPLDNLAILKHVPGSASPFEVPKHRLRETATYVFHAQKGEQITLELAYERVGQYEGKPLLIKLFSPAGSIVHSVEVALQKQSRLEVVAPQTGTYRLQAEPGQNTVRIVRTSHPVTIVGQRGVIHLLATTGRFFLFVPPDERLGVQISGDRPGECVAAKIFDDPTSGTPIWQTTGCEGQRSFVAEKAPTPRVFRLEFARPEKGVLEDEYITIRGVPALLSFAPDVLFLIAH